MREIESTASNFKEWLNELEAYEDKIPENDYCVKVSAKLMCKILRLAMINEPR